MKQYPILFSGPMIRAILEGRKTQTRRVVKTQPSYVIDSKCGYYEPALVDQHGEMYPGPKVFGFYNDEHGWQCPYGAPGDRLIVKEAAWMWCAKLIEGLTRKTKKPKVSWVETRNNAPIYCVDHPAKPEHVPANGVTQIGGLCYQWHKKNARFLPRWASRITLEIVSVRVERLLDITEADAVAEGCSDSMLVDGVPMWCSAVEKYGDLWESINGFESWQSNPWVWVVEFKRVEGVEA